MAVIARARALRKRLTPAEARLWGALRRLRAEGLHFRRQAPMRGYILDFVCIDRLLIVEVDGASHDCEDRQRKDRVRDAVLSREGFLTLRFSNLSVRDALDDVVQTVRDRCLARPTRLSLRASPPPRDGEGDIL
ncbi:MAG: very-short-patch-repair endonuclease [Brevundimonas sp.]|jgi:very-short-patch-repair endonuclease|uniref:endonuclease domain-containing protein n=1 Tax=Brevundimonas sp. TaxID=1871086 RepID=UPI0039E36655